MGDNSKIAANAVVLEEVNKAKKTDYQQSDVYFDFEDKDLPTNALENAQIALTEAQKRQMEINTILNLQTVIDDETRLQLIAEQLDLDYNDLKDKAPKPEEDLLYDLPPVQDDITGLEVTA